jgi:hypothetical protein
VVHFDGLDFGGDVGGREVDNHAGLDGAGFDTANGDCADTADLVYILEGETEGLVGRPAWGLDGVNSIQKRLSLDRTALVLLGPAFVPWHAAHGR